MTHREINDELLLRIPFFGLRRFAASLNDNNEFPSPNAGADPIDIVALALPLNDVPSPSLLPGTSEELRFSYGCSCILDCASPVREFLFVSSLYRGAEAFVLKLTRDSLVPAVAACGAVDNGFGTKTGVSLG